MPLPIGAAVGLSVGNSFLQGMLGYQAKKQQYVFQKAQAEASHEFAQWSATMQADQSNLNNRYKHWQSKINYGQQLNYAHGVRSYELSKAIGQADNVARARSSAGAEYILNSSALNEQLEQQSMADAMSMMQYKAQALRNASSIAAGGKEGGSVDRQIADYSRQVGDMQAMKDLNNAFRTRQLRRDQVGAIANYLNQYNSQQHYTMQEVQNPIAPYPPMATLVMPAPPSSVGAPPSAGAAFLGSALGAASSGLNTYIGLKSL